MGSRIQPGPGHDTRQFENRPPESDCVAQSPRESAHVLIERELATMANRATGLEKLQKMLDFSASPELEEFIYELLMSRRANERRY